MNLEYEVNPTIIIEPDGDEFHAYTPNYKGVHVSGSTRAEAFTDILVAIDLYKESQAKHDEPDFSFWRDFSRFGNSGTFCKLFVDHDDAVDEVTITLDKPCAKEPISYYYLNTNCAALIKDSDQTVVGFAIQLPKQQEQKEKHPLADTPNVFYKYDPGYPEDWWKDYLPRTTTKEHVRNFLQFLLDKLSK